MALINCPECDREISDKVKACPHCGFPFEPEDQAGFQQVEIASVKLASRNPARTKKIIYSIIGVVLVIAIGLGLFFGIRKYQADKKFNTYIDNVEAVRETMIEGGSTAESLLNLTSRVWYNSIFEERDPTTDEYTMSGGSGFNDDFNTSLFALMSADSTQATINEIKENQEEVSSYMKQLNEPPEELDDVHDTLTDLYTAYQSLINLALNPSGSLQTFSENKNQKIDNFIELYQKLDTQIPEKRNVLFESG
jgi:hypothetical protein